MQNLSILDNMLGAERAERLLACTVEDLCACLRQKCPADDKEMRSLLDQVVAHNPGIVAVNALHDDAMYELATRAVVDLDWKARTDGSISSEMKNGLLDLATFLAKWLDEMAEFEDNEEEQEYEMANEDVDF